MASNPFSKQRKTQARFGPASPLEKATEATGRISLEASMTKNLRWAMAWMIPALGGGVSLALSVSSGNVYGMIWRLG